LPSANRAGTHARIAEQQLIRCEIEREGMATIAVCYHNRSMLRSSRDGREITLAHQVPVPAGS
jgi:hypothetical protein